MYRLEDEGSDGFSVTIGTRFVVEYCTKSKENRAGGEKCVGCKDEAM